MRSSIETGILLSKKEIREKDNLLLFLTSQNKLIQVKDYHSQKSGSKSFPLFFTGEIFLYKKEDGVVFTLRDSNITIPRPSISSSLLSIKVSAFVDCVKYFSLFNFTNLFDVTNAVLDALERKQNEKKLFIYFAELFFHFYQSSPSYTICPVCNCEYKEDEKTGFSTNLFEPVCNNCADVKSVFLPGVRRYLNYIGNKSLDEALCVEIHQKALENVLEFEKFRLIRMNKNNFRNLEFI